MLWGLACFLYTLQEPQPCVFLSARMSTCSLLLTELGGELAKENDDSKEQELFMRERLDCIELSSGRFPFTTTGFFTRN